MRGFSSAGGWVTRLVRRLRASQGVTQKQIHFGNDKDEWLDKEKGTLKGPSRVRGWGFVMREEFVREPLI